MKTILIWTQNSGWHQVSVVLLSQQKKITSSARHQNSQKKNATIRCFHVSVLTLTDLRFLAVWQMSNFDVMFSLRAKAHTVLRTGCFRYQGYWPAEHLRLRYTEDKLSVNCFSNLGMFHYKSSWSYRIWGTKRTPVDTKLSPECDRCYQNKATGRVKIIQPLTILGCE